MVVSALPPPSGIYRRLCLKKTAAMVKDPHSPSQAILSQLPSGRRSNSLKSLATNVRNSDFPSLLESTGTTHNLSNGILADHVFWAPGFLRFLSMHGEVEAGRTGRGCRVSKFADNTKVSGVESVEGCR